MEISAAAYCAVGGVVAIFVLFAWKYFVRTEEEREASKKPRFQSLTHNIVPRVSPFFYKSVTTYGKNCFTWMGPKPTVHISEPTMIREILDNHHKFQKPKTANPLAKMLVSGLIELDGDKGVKHRKIINPAFHVEKLKHMLPAFYLSCNELIQKWGEMIAQYGVGEVDVWPDLQMFTRDVLSRTAFGSSFEEGGKIFDLQNEQAKLVVKAAESMFIPGYRFLPTKTKKRMQEIEREVKGSIRNISDKRVTLMKDGETSNDDLLGILLDSNHKEINEQKRQETSANMLVWSMILLAHHTDWQARARDEVLHVFGNRKPDLDG